MLKVTDEHAVTLREAATILGISAKRLNSWRCASRFLPVGFRPLGTDRGNLYRLGDIRRVAAVIGTGDPRTVETPPGHLRMVDAASRLGISPTVATAWFDKGRITGVVVTTNTRSKVRFPTEESVMTLAAALAKVDKGQSTVAKGEDADDIAHATPVLYGILDAGDVAVLEQRRQRMARSA